MKVSAFSSASPFSPQSGDDFTLRKSQIKKKKQTVPLMLKKPEMLHVEDPHGFFLGTAKGIFVHCLGVLRTQPGYYENPNGVRCRDQRNL